MFLSKLILIKPKPIRGIRRRTTAAARLIRTRLKTSGSRRISAVKYDMFSATIVFGGHFYYNFYIRAGSPADTGSGLFPVSSMT